MMNIQSLFSVMTHLDIEMGVKDQIQQLKKIASYDFLLVSMTFREFT